MCLLTSASTSTSSSCCCLLEVALPPPGLGVWFESQERLGMRVWGQIHTIHKMPNFLLFLMLVFFFLYVCLLCMWNRRQCSQSPSHRAVCGVGVYFLSLCVYRHTIHFENLARGGFFWTSSRVLHLIGKGERELQEWCLLRQNQSPKIASRLKNPMEEASM